MDEPYEEMIVLTGEMIALIEEMIGASERIQDTLWAVGADLGCHEAAWRHHARLLEQRDIVTLNIELLRRLKGSGGVP